MRQNEPPIAINVKHEQCVCVCCGTLPCSIVCNERVGRSASAGTMIEKLELGAVLRSI